MWLLCLPGVSSTHFSEGTTSNSITYRSPQQAGCYVLVSRKCLSPWVLSVQRLCPPIIDVVSAGGWMHYSSVAHQRCTSNWSTKQSAEPHVAKKIIKSRSWQNPSANKACRKLHVSTKPRSLLSPSQGPEPQVEREGKLSSHLSNFPTHSNLNIKRRASR